MLCLTEYVDPRANTLDSVHGMLGCDLGQNWSFVGYPQSLQASSWTTLQLGRHCSFETL
jgi:hypothetical protein